MNSKQKIGIGIAIILVVIGVGFGLITESPDTENSTSMPETVSTKTSTETFTSSTSQSKELSGIITIGSITALTGDFSSIGEENKESVKLGISTFNKYLEEMGALWNLKLISEDSATNPVIALEKLTALRSKGIEVSIGPDTSANLQNSKGYADSNGMIMISSSSTAPSLAIPDDSIFRMVADDRKQGVVLGSLLDKYVDVIIIVWRGDTWGDGLSKTTKAAYEELGGIVDDEGIRYNPETPEFSISVSLLADRVQKNVDKYGAENVGVLFLGFAEILQFMQSASAHDILSDVTWYGADASAKEYRLIQDDIALKFSNDVQFTTVQISPTEGEKYTMVEDHIINTLGRSPTAFAYGAFDAVWLVGLTMLHTQSSDADVIKDNIIQVAQGYDGIIGNADLNEAGDLTDANFDIWIISGAEWIKAGTYYYKDKSITLSDSIS